MNQLVAINLPPSNRLVDLIANCWANGDAVAVLDPRSPSVRNGERLRVLGAHWLIDHDGSHHLETNAPHLPSDARIVITTSGTTGPPKAIVHTESNLIASARAIAERLALTETDVWFCPLSPAYIGGLAVIARALLLGNPLHISGHLDQGSVDDALSHGATRTVAVSAALTSVDLHGFRTVLLGAQPPPDQVPSNAIVTYGMTETGSGVVYDGVPLNGVEARIVDGIIELRGPMIAQRYRDDTPIVGPDGWLITGDLGAFAPDGTLQVLGRASEVINSGGHKVNPLRVEAALRAHYGAALGDLCVVGTADERFGEAVTLATTTEHPPNLEQVRLDLTTLERWELPRRIMTVPAIPRTETGKPMRRTLGEMLFPALTDGAS